MFLTRISISQPVFATMVIVAISVLGLAAWRVLSIDRFPPLDFPVVVVSTPWSGATPEAVEAEITKPVEDALSTISGIDTITSTSSQGHSSVELTFTLETDSRVAAQDVRDRMASVIPDLPAAADPPQIVRFNPLNDPVMSLAISSASLDQGVLTRLARDVIVPRLTAIKGVGSATLVGATEPQVDVLIDPDLLRAQGLGFADVTRAIRAQNVLAPAGEIVAGTGSRPVQLNAEARDTAGLEDLILSRNGGAEVRLRDVAQVRRGAADADSLALQDGRAALALDVVKVDGANTVAVARALTAGLVRLAQGKTLGDARIDVLLNGAEEIEAIYAAVRSTLIEGMVLAIAIVFLFLNSWRSTVITGLTLPVSFLGTLAVMSLLGFSLNMLSMLALTLSVGIIIDDAIVVRENITRHLHLGKDHRTAALEGTQEIGLAVVATTLALCAVFLPLAFMDGVIGRMFLQFGVTVAVAVLISMFVSFTLDPMLSAVWPDPDSEPGARRGPVGRLVARFEHGFDALAGHYRHLLEWCLNHRRTTFALALASLLASGALVPLIGTELIPKTDESRISIALETAVGSSKDYTALKAGQITALARTLPEVAGVYATVASGSGTADNSGRIEITLVRPALRAASAEALAAQLRVMLERIPGVDLTIYTPGGVGDDEAPIALPVIGNDAEALTRAADQVLAAVRATPGTSDARLSSGEPWPMLDFVLMADVASDLGIGPDTAGEALNGLLNGAEIANLKWRDGRIDPIVARLPAALRNDPALLADLPVAADRAGQVVTLGQISQRQDGFGATRIERKDRSRVITVKAGLDGRLLGEVMADIDARLAALDLPEGITIGTGGDAELLGDTMTNMVMALGLAVIFIYLVLASQFASFVQPVAIMASLPLALSGVVAALLITGATINLYSMIGIVMLMGLVVKNAILLVDNANQHSRAGRPLHEALIHAGVTRFRPIIMTTAAMIFGMLPLALALSPGSAQSASMAQAVIGGLISSTLLTLVVVPVVLVWLAQMSGWLRRVLAPGPQTPPLTQT